MSDLMIEEYFAHLDEFHDEQIVVSDFINAEARGNLCIVGISFELAQAIPVARFAKWLLGIMSTRQDQIVQLGIECMTFYVWLDEQAGQLRFSMISGCDRLPPFGAPLDTSASLEKIVESFLYSPYVEGITLDSLQSPDEDDVDLPLPTIPIYIKCLRASA